MTEDLKIRDSRRGDWVSIESLYPAAFPDEDLLPVVRDLLRDPVVAISLVATTDNQIAGHVIYTRCGVTGSNAKVAMLAPLAVAPAWQGRGIGSALVRAGLQKLREEGMSQVYVLGDPAYYGRFGFRPQRAVEPPYPSPTEWADAWQSMSLREVATPTTPLAGQLSVPRQWLQPALWAPP